MSTAAGTPVSDREIIDELVRPLLFGDAVGGSGSLTVVVGQPGSGVRGVTAAIGRATGAGWFHVDDLAGLLPGYWDAGRRTPLEARTLFARRVQDLTDELIATGLRERLPVVVGDSFLDPDTVSALSAAASERNLPTRLVVVAARRSESLLTTVSGFLQARRRGLPVMFTTREEHERGWQGTEAVTEWAAKERPAVRLTVMDRNGSPLFDATGDAPSLEGAVSALDDARHARYTTRGALAWLGELRRVSEFARRARELSPPVAEVLLELEALAAREVLPDLAVRPGSAVVAEQERRIAAEMVRLREVLDQAEPVETPRVAPVVDVTPPDVEMDGPSL